MTGRLATVPLLVGLCAALLAADEPDGTPPPDHAWGNVAGRVLDAWGHAETAVTVRLSAPRGDLETRTDSLGAFRFAGVVVASEGDSATLSLSSSPDRPEARLWIPPGAVLAPFVVLEPGGVTVSSRSAPAPFASAPFAGRSVAAAVPWAGPWSIFATREGLVGLVTSNGHVITAADHFVALPSKRALNATDSSRDFLVELVNGARSVRVPVMDVGPWNTADDWWHDTLRERFSDLPRGVPQALAAFRDKYNGGISGLGDTVKNAAGIDLADGVFWGDLGMVNNGNIEVRLLWKLTASAGDRVRLRQWANVRDSAAGKLLYKADCGESGTVAGAPRAGVSGGKWYLYWPVAWDRGRTGWVVENYLTRDTASVSCSEAVLRRPADREAPRIEGSRLVVSSERAETATLAVVRPDGRILSRRKLALAPGRNAIAMDPARGLELVVLDFEARRFVLRRLP